MSTGLWQPVEPPGEEGSYRRRLTQEDTRDLLEYVRQDREMPRKEYEQFAFLLTHASSLEKELSRLVRDNLELKRQVKRMTPAHEAEMWREPYNGPVDQGQL